MIQSQYFYKWGKTDNAASDHLEWQDKNHSNLKGAA